MRMIKAAHRTARVELKFNKCIPLPLGPKICEEASP
jgi:hypothetical protein